MSGPAVLRIAATAALAGLTAAYSYYPVPAVAIAISVVGTLGVHVIPAATQKPAQPGGKS